MSFNSYGSICYGVKFRNGYEFPWNKEEFGDYINQWWFESVLSVTEYDNEFYMANRPPVSLISYAHSDCIILAIPSTVLEAEDCFPYWFDPGKLTFTSEEESKLINFIETYITKDHSKPKWWLSTYYG